MVSPIEQNILYELTKQRTSQSLKTKGAQNAFSILEDFLEKWGSDVTYNRSTLDFFVWVQDRKLRKKAKQTLNLIIDTYGKPHNRNMKQGGILSGLTQFNEMRSWDITPEGIQDALSYVDRLGPLPGLEPRPPVQLFIAAKFWIKDAPHTDNMKSSMLAWLSPSSNGVCLTLELPFETASREFNDYRKQLQADCPVILEDKYFYTRKHYKSGRYSFPKLLPGG